MNSPLEGIRVVEQGTFITGPCAGMMLADLGADVIKIESPEGDPYRSYQGGQYSPHFQAYNRNKRSLALDLKSAGDRDLFDQMIRQADVFIQNFRPGTAERLGAGAARLQQINPRLVYCSISGFGSTGPYTDRPSYDSVAQALSGFLSVVVDYQRPQFLGPALASVALTNAVIRRWRFRRRPNRRSEYRLPGPAAMEECSLHNPCCSRSVGSTRPPSRSAGPRQWRAHRSWGRRLYRDRP